MSVYSGSFPLSVPYGIPATTALYSLFTVQCDFGEMRLTVKRIFHGCTEGTATRPRCSGQRRRKAVLSEQVCHLLNTNDRLPGGKAPLGTPINTNASHGETH